MNEERCKIAKDHKRKVMEHLYEARESLDALYTLLYDAGDYDDTLYDICNRLTQYSIQIDRYDYWMLESDRVKFLSDMYWIDDKDEVLDFLRKNPGLSVYLRRIHENFPECFKPEPMSLHLSYNATLNWRFLNAFFFIDLPKYEGGIEKCNDLLSGPFGDAVKRHKGKLNFCPVYIDT